MREFHWVKKKWLLVPVAIFLMLSSAAPSAEWGWRTHGGTYGSRGIARVAFDRIKHDTSVSTSIRDNLNLELVRPGSVAPDVWARSPYSLDRTHVMTYERDQGAYWLSLAENSLNAPDNLSYYLGIASHYWADVMCYAHHDNARQYFENLYGSELGYSIWDSYHDHLELQAKYYRPKDPALIVGAGSTFQVGTDQVSSEENVLADESVRVGWVENGSIADTPSEDNVYEVISEQNTAAGTRTYVSAQTVTEGGADNVMKAQDNDENYEIISESDYGGSGNVVTNGTFNVDNSSWTFSASSGSPTGYWDSSGYANGGCMEIVAENGSDYSGVGIWEQEISTTIEASSTVLLSYAWKKGYAGVEPDTQNFSISVMKPSGATVDIDSQSGPPDQYDTWYTVENKDVSSFFDESGTYTIEFSFFYINGSDPTAADNVSLDELVLDVIGSKYRANVQHNITGIGAGAAYTLELKYYTGGDSEQFSVYIYNFTTTTWDYAGSLFGGSTSAPRIFENNIDSDHISGNEVRVRYVQQDDDATQSRLMLDYTRVMTGAPEYSLNWEHRVLVSTGRENYTVMVYGHGGSDESVDVFIRNFSGAGSWENMGTMNTTDNLIYKFIADGSISDYLNPSGGEMCIKYDDATSGDATRTSIYLDMVVVEENYDSVLAGFIDAAKAQMNIFIDRTMPPGDPLGGWFGDWIYSRKIEADDYSVYHDGNVDNVHYGSKELVDMATELAYSGWVYALGIQDSVSADHITWDQWWSREHRIPGVSFYTPGAVFSYP